ncbi:MAG: hypothetical protein OXF76_04125 [Caldilineaceae bacterium]|nr:hypothetical protein [Caldilineaceae bacterium]
MGKTEVEMDANVPRTANGEADQAGPECVTACIQALKQIRTNRRLLLDDKGRILEEYRKGLSLSGQPGPGDAFFKWLWENQANQLYCRIVPLAFHDDRGFVDFPDDSSLRKFHDDDRKFVAVALASGTRPELLNAVDRGWWQHRQALGKNGVNVVFLCPELMDRNR